jgi:hypothetical protein
MIPAGTVERGGRKRTVAEVSKADTCCQTGGPSFGIEKLKEEEKSNARKRKSK